jgi:hypothetical protein
MTQIPPREKENIDPLRNFSLKNFIDHYRNKLRPDQIKLLEIFLASEYLVYSAEMQPFPSNTQHCSITTFVFKVPGTSIEVNITH